MTKLVPSGNAFVFNAVQPTYDGGKELAVWLFDFGISRVVTLTPRLGSTLGGAALTLTGWNLDPGTTFQFEGAGLENVTWLPDGGLTATAPAHDAGLVALTTFAADGGVEILPNAFTYIQPPQLTAVTPDHGPATIATNVTLTGVDFWPDSGVALGGLSGAPIVYQSSTTLTARAPVHAAGVVDVVVTDPAGVSSTLSGGYTYDPPPAVTAITPAFGPADAGTAVVITGSSFVAGATVKIGGLQASGVVVQGPTSISAVTPRRPITGATLDRVVVTNPDLQVSNSFSGYRALAPPTVTSAAPIFGTELGGTSVMVTGVGLRAGLALTLGDVPATSLALSGPDTIGGFTTVTARTGPHDAGLVGVRVLNPDGQAADLDGGYEYVEQPVVAGLVPAKGLVTGFTDVMISGSGFVAGATIDIGEFPATSVVFIDAGLIAAKTPVHAAGLADVAVRNPPGVTGVLTGGYEYVPPAVPPTATSISPSTGPSAGATPVTITGSHFDGAVVKVFLGGAEALDVRVVDAATVTATTPRHPGGVVDLVVSVDGRQAAPLERAFTYVPGPTLVSLDPPQGPLAGGTVLTISGFDLEAGATVTLDGARATEVIVVDATRLTARTPARAEGRVDVVVKNPDGQSGALVQAFEYVAPAEGVVARSRYAFGCSTAPGGWAPVLLALGLLARRRSRAAPDRRRSHAARQPAHRGT